ncbi:hypothetical protein ACFQO4_20625 [Saliphagus sp. GCM10025334]
MTNNMIEFGGPKNATPRVLLALVVFIPLNIILGAVYAFMFGAGVVLAAVLQGVSSALAFIASPLPGPGVWSTYAKFFGALRGEQARVGSQAVGDAGTNIVQGNWAIAAPDVKLV